MATFGQRLKILREQRKLIQKHISELLGVSESTIGKYENDQRTPPPDTITRLADFFNVTSDYLLGRIDDPQGYKIKTIAAHRADDPTSGLPEEARKSIEDFKKFIFEKHGIKYD